MPSRAEMSAAVIAVLPFAASLCFAAGAGAVPDKSSDGAPVHWISEYFRCPDPMTTSLTTIDADGEAKRTDASGHGRGRTVSDSWDKRLSRKSVQALEKAVGKADLASLPGDLGPTDPRDRCMDCCRHTLTVKSALVDKEVSYDDVHIPAKLKKLLETIDSLLDGAPRIIRGPSA